MNNVEVTDYKLMEDELFVRSSTSKGTQIKYQKEGYWYKENKLGYEHIAEYLCSVVLKHSDCKNFVSYELCKVNGKSACRSRNFLQKGQEFITFQNLYEQYYGMKLTDKIMEFREVSERIAYTVDFMKRATKIDVTDYLKTILTLDMLCLNEDRHFDNLGVLYCEEKRMFTEAPIFDNGLSLCSDFGQYPPDEETDNLVSMVVALPFSGSFETQARTIGFGLKLDYRAIYEELEYLGQTEMLQKHRAISILTYQMQRYEKLLQE